MRARASGMVWLPGLIVAASANDAQSDTHWVRADVDGHFVRQAIEAGVDYRDRANLTTSDGIATRNQPLRA